MRNAAAGHGKRTVRVVEYTAAGIVNSVIQNATVAHFECAAIGHTATDLESAVGTDAAVGHGEGAVVEYTAAVVAGIVIQDAAAGHGKCAFIAHTATVGVMISVVGDTAAGHVELAKVKYGTAAVLTAGDRVVFDTAAVHIKFTVVIYAAAIAVSDGIIVCNAAAVHIEYTVHAVVVHTYTGFVAADAAVPKIQRTVFVINEAVIPVFIGIASCTRTDDLTDLIVAMAIGDGEARTGCKNDSSILVFS